MSSLTVVDGRLSNQTLLGKASGGVRLAWVFSFALALHMARVLLLTLPFACGAGVCAFVFALALRLCWLGRVRLDPLALSGRHCEKGLNGRGTRVSTALFCSRSRRGFASRLCTGRLGCAATLSMLGVTAAYRTTIPRGRGSMQWAKEMGLACQPNTRRPQMSLTSSRVAGASRTPRPASWTSFLKVEKGDWRLCFLELLGPNPFLVPVV